jgi:hypothetical protein
LGARINIAVGAVMKKSMAVGCCGVLAMALFAVGLLQSAAAGEEATVKVFVAWQGQGHTFQSGPKQATFVGALAGPLYTDTEKGPVHTGTMVCPTMVTIGGEDASQSGIGRCTLTDSNGAEIYAEFTCTGIFLVGCGGDLKLTGGSKQFEGISGGGHVTIRSDTRQFTVITAGVAKGEGTGILFVQELHYKLP